MRVLMLGLTGREESAESMVWLSQVCLSRRGRASRESRRFEPSWRDGEAGVRWTAQGSGCVVAVFCGET